MAEAKFTYCKVSYGGGEKVGYKSRWLLKPISQFAWQQA